MGTWTIPNTVKKAERLRDIMGKKLSRGHLEAEMYLLIGDDSLFDEFKKKWPDNDYRPAIVNKLKEILDLPDESLSMKWQPEARKICEKIVADYSLPKDTNISEEEFLERYRPLPNHLDDNASFDFGDGGCLYETYGAELEYVRAQPKNRVWTIIEGEGSPVIASGFHFVNRLGYVLTAKPFDDNTGIEVLLD